MTYPYFLGPDGHRLFNYYCKLNRWSFILMPLGLLLNEFFIRPHLDAYKDTPNQFLSIVSLTLNAQVPHAQWAYVYGAIVIYLIAMFVVSLGLPKWNSRPSTVGLKSGRLLLADYESAHFCIKNPAQKSVFSFWHSILMPFTFFLGSLTVCAVINLFRYLS